MKEIRIIPKADARFFEIQYIYEVRNAFKGISIQQNALALDLGINNLVTGVSSKGETFIIDGRRLKSINQWFNKKMQDYSPSRISSIFGKRRQPTDKRH